MPTDLDRLHKVAEWDRVPNVRPSIHRGGGVTYYDCHLVVGAVELGEEHILCVLPELRWWSHVVPMLSKIFFERDLPLITVSNRRMKSGESTIEFVVGERALRGYKGSVVYFR